jgi:hypothetical protein
MLFRSLVSAWGECLTNKFELYDILGFLIPGTLLVCWLPVCFPAASIVTSNLNFPSAFSVLALTALAVMFGHLIQAIGSIVEPVIYWTWGGRRSKTAFKDGINGYLSKSAAGRIKTKLERVAGSETSDMDLFYYALQRTDAAGIGRTGRFNSLYAYHRGLVVFFLLAIVLFAASIFGGAASCWNQTRIIGVFIGLGVLLVLVWYRTNQRDAYYVREVLYTAERVLDERNPTELQTENTSVAQE